MAWTRPTLTSLLTSTRSALTGALVTAGYRVDATIRRTPLRILADVVTGGLHLLYGTLEFASRQLVPSADMDLDYLVSWARLYGVDRRLAQASEGVFRFTGTNTTNIPSGTLVVRSDGVVYETTASGTITLGQADIAAVAQVAGAGGNLALSSSLALGAAITGVDSAVTAQTGWDTGTDDESKSSLLDRLLQRIRSTPQGGAVADYDRWSRAVAGVFRVQVVPEARGAGTVDVYFLHEEGTGIGIPTVGQIGDVQDYLDEVRPVTADVEAKAPSTTTQAYTFASLVPDTADTRAAVTAELDALYTRKALTGETIFVSDHWQAAVGAEGVTSVDITTPSANLVPTSGQVFTRGAITWPV